MSLTTDDTNGINSKSIPIHCIVEQLRRQDDRLHASPTNQSAYIREHDTYVIVPGKAPIGDLVRIALVRIGYTAAEGLRARGYIQVKNWKPLSFESITDNFEATVEEILGDLLPVATLWVRLTSDSSLSALEDIKEKLLHILVQQSQSLLSSSGCPLDKAILSEITRGDVSGVTLSPEKQTTFNRWYHEQTSFVVKDFKSPPRDSVSADLPNRRKIITDDPDCNPSANPASASSPCPSDPGLNYGGVPSPDGTSNVPDYRSLTPETGNNNEGESVEQVRLMRKWYDQDSNPSIDQMTGYASQLNVLRRRRGLHPTTSLDDVVSWFQRAREAELKVPSNRSESVGSDYEEEDGGSGGEEQRLDVVRLGGSRKRPRSDQLGSSSGSPRSKAFASAESRPSEVHQRRGLPGTQQDPEIFPGYWRNEPEEETCTSGPRGDDVDDDDDDDYIRCGLKYPDDRLCRVRLPTEEATDLTVRAGSDPRIGAKKSADDQLESRALSVKAEMDSRGSVGGHVRKTHSACASPMTLPFMEPAATDPATGYLLHHRACTPPQLRHFRQQHVMRLQAAMSQALNLHYIQHPSIYHPHPSFDSGRMLLPGGSPRGPYKDPNRLSPTDSGVSDGDRRKRSRVFIDPLTEIPRLERWFTEDTHPSAYMIEQFTDELNRSAYRQRFPPLEPKNVQLWFKNHRAKVKRQKIELNSRSPS